VRDFDVRLRDVPFVAGVDVSAADITAIVAVDFAPAAWNTPISEDSRRWYETVATRPSAKAYKFVDRRSAYPPARSFAIEP
jgi:glutathione S-transferase